MKTSKIALLLACPLLFNCPAFASGKTSKEGGFSLGKLQAAYKDSGSLETDFVQEVYQASLARTKTSKGTLKLSKPNFVRWETYEPEASVMVSNGRKVYYYTPDARGKGKGQVIERTAGEISKQPLFRILTGTAPLDKEFKVEKQAEISGPKAGNPEEKTAEKTTELHLKPRKHMGDLVAVHLKIDSNYLIQELITESESGNKTKFTLQNQALGAKLPPALFDFKPPADTEVLQN
jgi:outer membrane lipoprotein carrier protein